MIWYHIIYDLSKVWMIFIFRVILWKRDLYIITTETTDYLITDAPPGPRIIKRCARSSDRLHSYHLSYDYTQLTIQIIVLVSYNSIVKTTQVSDCFKGIKFKFVVSCGTLISAELSVEKWRISICLHREWSIFFEVISVITET